MPKPDSGFSGHIAGLNALELCACGNTFLHRLHPFVKLTTTIFYVVVVLSFGPLEIGRLLPYFFYPAILIPLSETPLKILLKRLLPALPFSLFGGLSNVFFNRAPIMSIGGMMITGGEISFVSIMIKTILSVSAILLLVSTTGIDELSRQLSSMGIPNILVTQLVITYRYLSVLVDEARSMFTSYVLRSPGARGVRAGHMGFFVGSLLLRSIDRAERVYSAMRCRGFTGYYRPRAWRRITFPELACLGVVCGALLLSRCLR
ncbi:MAG: cobalt ECF transporter T component CbiQ [Synergistaceae bacterium]|jgi:cobalt/nickel transport system permease protein|nr:cobalt ECF transporter T component CbiQ [Synergistaceae bacterium]